MSNKKPVVGDEPSPEATDQAPDTARRAALRKLAAGLGLTAGAALVPERWSKPVVETIVSPAHAEVQGTFLPPTTATP